MRIPLPAESRKRVVETIHKGGEYDVGVEVSDALLRGVRRFQAFSSVILIRL
jgi:hypothetical protein